MQTSVEFPGSHTVRSPVRRRSHSRAQHPAAYELRPTIRLDTGMSIRSTSLLSALSGGSDGGIGLPFIRS